MNLVFFNNLNSISSLSDAHLSMKCRNMEVSDHIARAMDEASFSHLSQKCKFNSSIFSQFFYFHLLTLFHNNFSSFHLELLLFSDAISSLILQRVSFSFGPFIATSLSYQQKVMKFELHACWLVRCILFLFHINSLSLTLIFSVSFF